jgi:hypothetical protein
MMELRGRSLPMWTPHSAASAVHPIKRNGSAHVPAGTSQRAQSLNAIFKRSSRGTNAPVEEGAGFEHRVHNDGEFTGNGNSRTLEADPFAELEAPGPQTLSAELRVRMTVAATKRSPSTWRSPRREIWPS